MEIKSQTQVCGWLHVPEEGELLLIHAGLQSETRILSKRRDNETENQGDAHEHSRKNDLEWCNF